MDHPSGARNPVLNHAVQDGGIQQIADALGAAVTLDGQNDHILAELPAGAGVLRTITLPPASDWIGREKFVEAYGTLGAGATGVRVVCQGDTHVAYTSGTMKAANDHIIVKNYCGRAIVQMAEHITP
jgi:hypothetical protein